MLGKNATEIISANAAGIARAADILESGGLVAVPTETVYGLAARADSAEAVARIYSAKGRPDFNPLIVHVSDVGDAAKLAAIDDTAQRLIDDHWPGPLTLVLPKAVNAPVADAVTAGLDTIALRCPAHPIMRALLEVCDFPIAAPSANLSGFISPTTPRHVLASLNGRVDLVLDGGACEKGLESTIVAVRAGGILEVLRPGPIAFEAVSQAELLKGDSKPPSVESPGQLASHYAPGKPVRLNAAYAQSDEFMIGFGVIAGDCNLSDTGDLTEAASNLYDCLHLAAGSDQPHIAIAPIPKKGVGIAINDRLHRAAA